MKKMLFALLFVLAAGPYAHAQQAGNSSQYVCQLVDTSSKTVLAEGLAGSSEVLVKFAKRDNTVLLLMASTRFGYELEIYVHEYKTGKRIFISAKVKLNAGLTQNNTDSSVFNPREINVENDEHKLGVQCRRADTVSNFKK